MYYKLARNDGFTMIELVMVIVILAVLGVAGADFISQAFLGFSQTNSRLELYEEGKTALARMERELHGMLPNAICVRNGSGACISNGAPGNEIRFGMIAEYGMRNSDLVGRYSESSTDINIQPDVITDINAPQAASVSTILSIYNTSWGDFNTGTKLFEVLSISNGADPDEEPGEMTLIPNITTSSPYQRYYIVDRAVSYRWDSSTGILWRAAVPVDTSGPNYSSLSEYPLARDVVDFDFYYAAPSLARNGIVSMVFTLSKNGEQINMHKEIHVKNVP